MQTVTDALVLRERKLDEQDRLLTLLSADRGIITAYAKGAGRMKGSMAGATELLCYSHFVLFQNRERCFADKAEANTLFFGIRGDLEKLTLATYFAQLCCELIPENEPAVEELRLLSDGQELTHFGLVPVSTVDIGLAQLAMHSAWETMGAEDCAHLAAAARQTFETVL